MFWPPALGYLLASLLDVRDAVLPSVEARFLACVMPLLAAMAVVQEIGLSPPAWLWLGVNLALGGAVLVDWRRASRLQAHQAQAADQ